MGEAKEEVDYRFWGNPIENDFESRGGQYRKGPNKDPSSTRQLPVWKQVRTYIHKASLARP